MAVDRFLRNSAQRVPAKLAVTCEDFKIAYRTLDQEVDNLAGGLLKLGLAYQGRVGVLLGNTPDYFRSYFAILRSGGIIVPINPLLKAQELIHIFMDAEITHLITTKGFLPLIENIRPQLPKLKKVLVTQLAGEQDNLPEHLICFEDLLAAKSDPVFLEIQEDDLAACLYTSGTSGKPKGALLSHGNLMFDALQSIKRTTMNTEDRHLCILPLFHSFAQMGCMVMPISLGGCVRIVPQFLPGLVIKEIEEHSISFLCAVPAMYNALLSALSKSGAYDFSSLRICVSGGAPLPREVSREFREKYGLEILEGNGPTETSPVAYVNPPEANKPGSVGPPLDEVRVKIVDDNDLEVSQGEIGEICVKGGNVMQGYLNLPRVTAEVLKDGWLHTGDLGKVDEDGYVYILDRKKDMIIVGGLNVYPREVEECLYQHPKILEAAVIGVHDKERDEVPKAYVVLKPDCTADPKEILLYCRKNLANYKCPRTVAILAKLPKNSSGKIDKKLIKEEESLGLLEVN
jgi:long-chain acyl-CoA synthetase